MKFKEVYTNIYNTIKTFLDNKKTQPIIYSILLFLILSIFTVFPHIDLIKYRSSTTIDNNTYDPEYISNYSLEKNNFITTEININKNLKSLTFKIDNAAAQGNIQIQLSQGDISATYNFEPSPNIEKNINIADSKFTAGKLQIKIINNSSDNVTCITNYPNIKSGYVLLNGSEDINVFSLYIKLIYSGSEFFIITIILFIAILLIQAYIVYLALIKKPENNSIYYLTVLLFLFICIFRYPTFTFWAEPIAESLTHYIGPNLNEEVSITKMFLLTDMSMTYFSSMINILGRFLHLDKYLAVYLYLSGIIIACFWAALYTRISLRKYFPDYVRLIITFSLLAWWDEEAFYISSMFTYWGMYFIIFMYLIDLDKLSKKQYILGMVLIFLIINNKMSYIFLIPAAFLFIFYYGFKERRKLYMQFVILFSCIIHYVVYSLVTPAESERHTGIIERVFQIDRGIIRMLDGVTSVTYLNAITIKNIEIVTLVMIVALICYSIYVIYKNKNLENHGYVILVLLVAVFMSQYIHIVSDFGTARIKEEFNSFLHLPHGRQWYMLYYSVYMLVIYLFYLLYKKYNGSKAVSVIFIIVIVFFGMKWYSQYSFLNVAYIGKYKNIYTEYYSYLKNNSVSIPVNPGVWSYNKKAHQKIYFYNNSQYLDKNDNNTYIIKEYSNINSILSDKCLVSLHTNFVDAKYITGKITAYFYDKDGKLIDSKTQLNKTNYSSVTKTYMSYVFDKPICNIDKIEFKDEDGKNVYTTFNLILGLINK